MRSLLSYLALSHDAGQRQLVQKLHKELASHLVAMAIHLKVPIIARRAASLIMRAIGLESHIMVQAVLKNK